MVIATARAAGFTQVRVYDDSPSRVGTQILGLTIEASLTAILDREEALAVLAIGDNANRARLAARTRCELATIVHPSACVDPTATLGAGTVVFAGCVVQPDT